MRTPYVYYTMKLPPWFRDATVAQLSAIERPNQGHLRWPELDVDLTLESIDRPADFPLVSRKP